MRHLTIRSLRIQASGLATCVVLIGLIGWGFSLRTTEAHRAVRSIPIYVGVDVTATGGTLNASYATLQAAFAAINAGTHTGTITLDITADTTETASAVLNASGSGSASYTSVLIRPAGGAARTISGNLNVPLIDLSGADNVTIDGLNTGGNALMLVNASNTTAAATIRFITGATNNIVQNTTINGATTGTTSGTVFFSTDGATLNGNDNNQVINCDLGSAGGNFPVNAVYSAGTTSTTAKNNSGNLIANCRLFDFYATTQSAGVLLAGGNTDWTLSGNSLYQTAARVGLGSTTQHGIFINNANGNNFSVTGNVIGGSAVNAGGSPWTVLVDGSNSTATYRFIGVRLVVGTATASSVQNNTITNFDWKTSSSASTAPGVWCGIYVNQGLAHIGTVTGNTIGSGTGTDAVTVATSTNGGTVFGIVSEGSSNAQIANNTVGSVTALGITGSGGASNSVEPVLKGLRAASTGGNTLTNNLIGSLTTAHSLRTCTPTTTTANCSIIGIETLNTATATNNTVANLTSYGAGSSTQTKGIVMPAGGSTNITIQGNTVRHLTTTANASASGFPIHVGIETTGGVCNVAGNTVYGLHNTNPSSSSAGISGIVVKGDTTVERNLIHSLTTAADGNGNSWVTGMMVESSGTKTIRNNMIRLGLDENGNSVVKAMELFGIFVFNSSAAQNIYHNSIYLGGTGVNNVAGRDSVCLYRFGSGALDVRNNILVNNRSQAVSTTLNIAISYDSPTTNLTSNGNIYQVTGLGSPLAFLSTFRATLADVRAAMPGQDLNSGVGDPNFVNPAGSTATLDLHVNSPTPAEGAGIAIAAVTTDYDNQTRSALTPTDIGADALNATAVDIFTPIITFTPLVSTGSMSSRTLTATITDNVGVPTAGAFVPRIYYRKGAGAWFSQPGTLASGTGTNGTWNFTINYADVGGVIMGSVISYYVIAQDMAGNLTSNALGVVATNVNTVTTHPSAPNKYGIMFSGTINVGTGQPYATITNAGGLFEAINDSGLAGHTTINIVSDIIHSLVVQEFALNQWAEEGAGGYTLTIQPSGGAARLCTGFEWQFNGADRVTIDGLNMGGNALTVRGLNSAVAVWFRNDASNNTVRNCTIEANNNSTNGVLNVTNGTTTGNDNLTITNNTIRNRSDAGTNAPSNLIYAAGGVSNSNITISNNQFFNFTNSGIRVESGNDNWTISDNTIYQTAARTTALAGINFSATGTNTITQNVIRDLNSTALKQGIAIGTVATGTTFSRNRIYNFSGTGVMYGIDFTPSLGATSHATLVNNQITLTATSTSQSIIGIRDNSTNASAGSLTAYYNSVFIGGTATGTVTQAFRIEASAKSTTLRNNILVNQRTGGSVAHYALDRASNAGSFSSNYNLLVGTGSPTTANFIGRFGTAVDFATWQAGTGTPDLNSFASEASGINANVFTDTANGNLNINIGGDVATLDLIARHATPLTVTTDFSNAARHATTPDIGADEFNVLPVITPQAGLTRTQGNPVGNSLIATATDLEDPESSLALAVSSDGVTYGSSATLNSVTINNLAINASGEVTADIVAGCAATLVAFNLRITDVESGQTVGMINVTVTVNPPPVLSYNPIYSVPAGCPIVIQPLTGPGDNFQVVSVTLQNVTPALTFAPTVNAAGVVTIPAANPGGDHVFTIRAVDNCGLVTDATFTLDMVTLTLQPAANVNGTTAAPGSVVTTQGRFFTATQQTANALPLPTTLAGVTVAVTDSLNVTRPAELFYVTPTTLSFIIPAATTTGAATVAITTVSSGTFTETLQIADVAPGIFTVNQQPSGLANGYVIRDNGVTQAIEPITRFNPATRQWEAVPINVSTDQVYLVMNGSGLRNGNTFNVTVGVTPVTVSFAGAATNPPGYDQVKVLLPASLAGSGLVSVNTSVNSQPANTVMVQIQ